MKKSNIKLPLIISAIIFIQMVFGTINENMNSGNLGQVADGFTIEEYEVILDVGVDNKVEVTEKIDVNFYENHHGIYKFTPEWLEYTSKDNKTIKRKSKISDYRAEGDEYTTDTVGKGKERIKIGSAHTYVSGDKTYTIKYTYDMGKDPYKKFDEFIFHAFGDYWGTEIKNPRIIVHMPKSIEGYNINFFTDKYRKNNVNNLVVYQVDGNTLTAKYNGIIYPLKKSLTVDIELPKDYFEGGSNNYGILSLITSIIIFGLSIIIIYKWVKYGKDFEKRVPTVEFYAPDNLNPAEIGYIFNNKQATKKLTISLIVELASKGYIKIDDIKEGKHKSKIQITKLKNRPLSHKSVNGSIPERQIEVRMIKQAEDNEISNYGMQIMNYLFEKGNVKLIKPTDRLDAFLKVKDELVEKGYIEIISDNNYLGITDEKEKRELHNEQIESYNKNIDVYNENSIGLADLSGMEKVIYDKLFEHGNTVILSDHNSFYQVFNEVENDLKLRLHNKIHDEKSESQKTITHIINAIVCVLSLISFYFFEDLSPQLSILYYLSFACIILNLIFIIIMTRKTDYGEIISARIKGFRNFLVTAEKGQLEELVNKNPHYFYDILPYTYVLNISKKWIKKFEDIPMPKVEMGNFDYGSSTSINSIYTNISYPVSTNSSSSSGCSSCGGGCSSCGGGCSSCGGGGSW